MFRWLAIVFFSLGLLVPLGWFAWSAHEIAAGAQDVPIVTAPARDEGHCPPVKPIVASGDEKRDYGGKVEVSIDGITDFCQKFTENPLCKAKTGRKLTFSEVLAQDSALRSHFTYVSDDILYQRSDFYAENGFCGDCEDYALTLAHRLSDAGADGTSMWLEIWNPAWIGGHATLLVQTSDKGMIEIGVGDPPEPYTGGPVRLGRIQMDGKLEVQLYEGVKFIRRGGDTILSKADTRAEAIKAGYLKE
ncbi:peptidase [Caulobacter phage CcrBL10]|uniref:Transglutaminase-like cysteine peptidase n=1 Tax=Caulobacter phage CcrBL10 TaxID=2283269 RepID=A0A385EB90_9CAUD|nr:peptidase [Caulobacter phage CcrBL10]AXQ68245.1 hypothetical protein CcrBL10_gp041c [Caulobacter phage CcrBL10]